MEYNMWFKIADHILEINVPSKFNLLAHIPNFETFVIDHNELLDEMKPLIKVKICLGAPILDFNDNLRILASGSPVWGEGFQFRASSSVFVTSLSNFSRNSKLTVVSTKDFSASTIYLGELDSKEYSIISWAIMVAFGQGVLKYNTLILHASVVEKEGCEAYAFLGKSGTGKSTHSQLWLKYLDNFRLLNDDNPAIRVFGNENVYIYGTPWSGKTSCYRNAKAPLMGVIRLRQASFNRFELKNNVEAFLQLLPSCSGIKWNKQLFEGMLNTIALMVNKVPVGLLDCQINQQAVEYSYYGIKLKNYV